MVASSHLAKAGREEGRLVCRIAVSVLAASQKPQLVWANHYHGGMDDMAEAAALKGQKRRPMDFKGAIIPHRASCSLVS